MTKAVANVSTVGARLFADAVDLLLCACGIIVCFFLASQIRIALVHDSQIIGEQFDFGLILIGLTSLGAAALSLGMAGSTKVLLADSVPRGEYAACAAAYVLAMACRTWAQPYVSHSAYVFARSSKPVFVMVYGLFAGERFGLRKYFHVCTIIVGIFFFSRAEAAFSVERAFANAGEAFLVVSLICDGITAAFESRLKRKYRSTPMSTMFFVNLFATCYATLAAVANGEFARFLLFIAQNATFCTSIVLFLALSSVGQYFIFKTIHNFSPLTCAIITTTRRFLTIIVSSLFVGRTFTQLQTFSAVIVMTSLSLDAFEYTIQFEPSLKQD